MHIVLPSLAAMVLSLGLVSSAPVGNDTASDGAVQIFNENGISCLHYPQAKSDGSGRIYIQCSKIPTFWEVRAVWKSAELTAALDSTQSQESTAWFNDNSVHYSDYKPNVKNNLDTTVEWRQRQDGSAFGDCSSSYYPLTSGDGWVFWIMKIDCSWMDPDVRAMATGSGMATKWATADALHQMAQRAECPLGNCSPDSLTPSEIEALSAPDASAQDWPTPTIIWDYRYA